MVVLNKRYSSREICEKLQILAKEYSDIAGYSIAVCHVTA